MPSRRRSRSKNLTNNLADVQRRLRFLERRPVRTRLSNRVVTRAALAPNSVSEDEVSFGTAIVVPPGGNINDVIAEVENPKDGLLVVDTDSGSSKVYYEDEETYVDITDPNAQLTAEEAQQAADDAQTAADEAQLAADDALLAADAAADSAALADQAAQGASLSANGKNAVFRQSTEPTQQVNGAPLRVGDIWFDTTAISKDGFTDTTGSRPRRYAGPGATVDARWPFFGLSYAAITSIDADRITAGTLTGRTIQTAQIGKRVELSNTNELIFRGPTSNTIVGKIAPDLYGSLGLDISGGASSSDSPTISLRGSAYSGDSSITMVTPTNLGIYIYNTTDISDGQTSSGGLIINGGGSTSGAGLKLYSGQGGFEFVDWSGSAYGTTIYAYNDQISINSDIINLSGSRIEFAGDLVLGFGTYQQGTGQPSGTGVTGTVIFRYT